MIAALLTILEHSALVGSTLKSRNLPVPRLKAWSPVRGSQTRDQELGHLLALFILCL